MEAFFQHKHSSRLSAIENLDYPAHLHRAVEFGYLFEGESVLTVGGKEYLLQAGRAFVIFPDQVHLFEKSQGVKGVLGIARVEELAPLGEYFENSVAAFPVIGTEEGLNDDLRKLFARAYTDPDRREAGILQGYLFLLLGKLLPLTCPRKDGEQKGELKRILTYLEANYRENLTRGSIAREMGISESTLSHLFSSALHLSLPRFLTLLRLEEAQRLLSETELSVTAVAARSGFPSLRSFNRAFRDHFGCSPSHMRKEKKLL